MGYLILKVLVSLFVYTAFSKEIPSYVHLCKRNDPKVGECFVNTVYEMMPHLLKGIPEMDIPPIEPLQFSLIQVNTGNTGSVNMNVELLNGTVIGLRNLKVDNHTMDFDNIIFKATLTIPFVNIESVYRIQGKILLFQLNGYGHVSFNASNVVTNGIWMGSTYMKKGKKHVNIDDIHFNDVAIQNIRVRLDRLFGDNVALTETVNDAINNNVDSLREDLEPIIKETLTEIIRDYFNRVYKLFPMDNLYLLD